MSEAEIILRVALGGIVLTLALMSLLIWGAVARALWRRHGRAA